MDCKVSNIVANTALGFPVNLKKMASCVEDSEYDPEIFPGLILKYKKKKSLIFGNGKIVITGSKSIEELERRALEIKSICEKYKMEDGKDETI